ncbi:ATP-binding cassette domain-containing protein [Bittarella massiliensis (ex Durand et al. 2017)]|uniref:ATP-binding cassette domain-containing protein n=1 Tax=Bittarella massiliensis (ex Durand et al. 2017) TaxID=1720313 RepID=UPI001AA12EC7|nr:ATP-binding cassette domain-containing protein [Bittarella massiliensis (ex Durand et al. 2017)]MBO1678656.1 ATP-binding cassette domain-containing protein [Bittarella massiliensis (ex Durand et al. 2017)]
MLEMKAVQKSFKKKMVLKGIDCEIGEGVYGLLGPNGAGKTTLMRCVVGLYSLQGGQILFDGKDVAKNGDLLAHIGYLPQKFGLFKELKVYHMMEYFATLKNIPKEEQRPAIEKSLEIVNLSERMGDRVGALSGGMIRRLGIAQAVLGEPEVILFDEPTAGLDPEERMRFKNIIAAIKKGRTILISTHIVEDVEAVCDHILVMDNGQIIGAGTDSQVRAAAQGKVYLIPEREKLPDGSYIEKRLEGEEGVLLRILSPVPLAGAREAAPTVEDGYMSMIKRI